MGKLCVVVFVMKPKLEYIAKNAVMKLCAQIVMASSGTKYAHIVGGLFRGSGLS